VHDVGGRGEIARAGELRYSAACDTSIIAQNFGACGGEPRVVLPRSRAPHPGSPRRILRRWPAGQVNYASGWGGEAGGRAVAPRPQLVIEVSGRGGSAARLSASRRPGPRPLRDQSTWRGARGPDKAARPRGTKAPAPYKFLRMRQFLMGERGRPSRN
jgi:hypothetical protein